MARPLRTHLDLPRSRGDVTQGEAPAGVGAHLGDLVAEHARVGERGAVGGGEGAGDAARYSDGFGIGGASEAAKNVVPASPPLLLEPALLATVARQAAQIYAKETGASEDAARERIREAFESEIASSEDAGTVTAVR